MEHDFPLITTIAAGFGLALVLGFAAERIKLPALVGYLLAGIAIGPAMPGSVADMSVASQLSEIGVMLLMFGVGLHFSLDDLLAVKRIALPGALVQMLLATVLGMGLAWSWGWSIGAALIFGLSLSCASTVVLIKALEARGILETMNGRIAVGWLVVEDLATVLLLVLLPPLAGVLGGSAAAETDPLWQTIGRTLLEVAAFIAVMLIAGRRVLPWLLWQATRTGSRELFTLSVVTAAIGIAYGAAELFSVSFALGAFFAGMMMRESEFSHRAAEESLPLRDAFAVLFFVAVGMLFDPSVVMEYPMRVLAVVAIIIDGKSLAAMALVLAFRYPLNTALTVAASLAQIGEFSFILAGLGVSLGQKGGPHRINAGLRSTTARESRGAGDLDGLAAAEQAQSGQTQTQQGQRSRLGDFFRIDRLAADRDAVESKARIECCIKPIDYAELEDVVPSSSNRVLGLDPARIPATLADAVVTAARRSAKRCPNRPSGYDCH